MAALGQPRGLPLPRMWGYQLCRPLRGWGDSLAVSRSHSLGTIGGGTVPLLGLVYPLVNKEWRWDNPITFRLQPFQAIS